MNYQFVPLLLIVVVADVCDHSAVSATATSTGKRERVIAGFNTDIRWNSPERLNSQAWITTKRKKLGSENGNVERRRHGTNSKSQRELSNNRKSLQNEAYSHLERYIVRLRNDPGINQHYVRHVVEELRQNAENSSLPDFIAQRVVELHAALEGLTGTLSEQALDFLIDSEVVADYSLDSEVFIIEPSEDVKILPRGELRANRTKRFIRGLDEVTTAEEQNVNDVLWNLDRVDDRTGLDQTYTYEYTGAGVDVYVIDSGVRTTHETFGGRAEHGENFFGGEDTDCQGHGMLVCYLCGMSKSIATTFFVIRNPRSGNYSWIQRRNGQDRNGYIHQDFWL
eukprot:gb/GECG01015922.1/.p1 GENE.gb/GECG01015922.1/~~gb/GECG01015922.1/.p1  ORF type:complete len:338 (+),score=26.38 gb/GECG01015922.1/:1-1014(+)